MGRDSRGVPWQKILSLTTEEAPCPQHRLGWAGGSGRTGIRRALGRSRGRSHWSGGPGLCWVGCLAQAEIQAPGGASSLASWGQWPLAQASESGLSGPGVR